MADLKTKKTAASVSSFVNAIPDRKAALPTLRSLIAQSVKRIRTKRVDYSK